MADDKVDLGEKLRMLKVASIFHTLDGECTDGGPLQWATFVRLGGCNLRCWKSSGFCDAPHTLDVKYPYPEMTVEQIHDEVQRLSGSCRRVTLTGGEPLVQYEGVRALAWWLSLKEYRVCLETSGSIDMPEGHIKQFASVIMDIKPPSTEMSKSMVWALLGKLRPVDYVKCVVQDKDDFKWMMTMLADHPTSANVAIGPKWGMLHPKELLGWLRKYGLFTWRLNLQLHKILWPEVIVPGVDSLDEVDFDRFVEMEV